MLQNIAVLDWDNTICKEVTLIRWEKILIEKNVIDKKVEEDYIEVQNLYNEGKITYDDAVTKLLESCANSLKGCKYSEILKIAEELFAYDIKFLFTYSELLFNELKKHNILPIIVSGAPIEILSFYKEKFDIKEIYAFEIEIQNNIYTGNIISNTATFEGKSNIINKLKKEGKYNIVLAAGDSSADRALLESSPNGIVVNNFELAKNLIASKKNNILNIDSNCINQKSIKNFLNNLL